MVKGLIKSKMTNLGVEANYWRLSMISIDRHMKEASFSLNLYISKESYENGSQFIESYNVSLLGLEDKTIYESYFETNAYTSVYDACYAYAKSHDEYFMDAIEDIID